MKHTLIILSLISAFSHNNAMKRKNSPQALQIFHYYDHLLPEVQNIIIDFCTHHTIAKKPKDATYRVYALSYTNKNLHTKINEPEFSDNLIDTFAYKFYCSHETIAKYLGTEAAKERLSVQLELKNLIMYNSFIPKCITCNLQQLQQEGLNLDFTYNYETFCHSSMPKTALMMLVSMEYCAQRERLFDWL